ncbi:hypothetical protein LPEG9_01155 [Lacticaseibacillus paracasei]|nr:hypothetical protein LPEG9_01155 [Lacticaseibacillus paracasei]
MTASGLVLPLMQSAGIQPAGNWCGFISCQSR